MSIPSTCPWTWRKLFQLRAIAKPLIKYSIGNGADTFLRFDHWHPLWHLYDFLALTWFTLRVYFYLQRFLLLFGMIRGLGHFLIGFCPPFFLILTELSKLDG